MRSRGAPGLLPVILVGFVLLGPMLAVAGAQTASVPRVALFPASAEPPVVLEVGDSLTEFLVSEMLLLLVTPLGCALLVLGLEAIDLWRERRSKRRGLRTLGSGAPSCGTLRDA